MVRALSRALERAGSSIAATWNAPSEGHPTGYNLWLDENLVAENVNETSHSFNVSGNDFHCVQVQAVYGDGVVSVKAVATTTGTVGTAENLAEAIAFYPNPASGMVHFQGIEAKSIMVYNALGQLVEDFAETHDINVASLPNGVYICILKEENAVPKIARIIVNH